MTRTAIADQRTDDEVPVNVLQEWAALSSTKDLSKRDVLVASIKALEAKFRTGTKNLERVAKVSAAFDYLEGGNWDAFLLAVTWVFDAANYVSVRADAEGMIGADARFTHLPAHLVFERLLVEVLQCSSNQKLDDRELTRDRLVQIATLTKAELDQWLANNSGVLARLSRFEADLADVRQLVTLARRPPSPRALRTPTAFATSARLTEGVEAVEIHVAAGARVIGLRGAPGDGKTQVARQLGARASGASYWELPNAANTTGSIDTNEVWRVGLGELAAALSGEICADLLLDALARLIREHMGLLPRPHLLILDNADSDPPIDLRDLISDEAACVAVGGGAVRQRVLAVLRDAGALDAAAAIADREKDVEWYWTECEVVETWRWIGEFDKASELLAKMAADPRNARSLNWINDEKAKLLAKQGDLAGARLVLEANAAAWRASNEPVYAEQCESWLRSMEKARVNAADGILQDEWRSKQRRSAVADIELGALEEASKRIAAGILASKRRLR